MSVQSNSVRPNHMQSLIGDFLSSVSLANIQTFGNLAVFPLVSERHLETDYLTLDQALATPGFVVKEVDESGDVPTLIVKNNLDRKVLILDGEEFVGAKQNRIANTTILIDQHSELPIPVSCVEEGRWADDASDFKSHKRMAFATLRGAKTLQVQQRLAATGTFEADQSQIWQSISDRTERSQVPTQTRAMADIYAHEQASLDGYAEAFHPIDGQVGAVFALAGKVLSLEAFGATNTLEQVLPKLVESYALDAVDMLAGSPNAPAESSAKRFVTRVRKATFLSRPSVGLGTDGRVDAPGLTGLAFGTDSQLLHLSVFASNNPSPTTRTRMARFSERSR